MCRECNSYKADENPYLLPVIRIFLTGLLCISFIHHLTVQMKVIFSWKLCMRQHSTDFNADYGKLMDSVVINCALRSKNTENYLVSRYCESLQWIKVKQIVDIYGNRVRRVVRLSSVLLKQYNMYIVSIYLSSENVSFWGLSYWE